MTAVSAMMLAGLNIGGIDPYTTLMLHMDGANGGTTFTDSSALGQVITTGTGVTSSDTTAKFGAAGQFASGSGLSFSPGTSLDLPGDFTIDFWMSTTTITADGGRGRSLFAFALDGAATLGAYVFGAASGLKVLYGTSTLTGTTNIVTGAVNHIAIVRSGTTLSLYVNGVLDDSVTTTISFAAATTARIGSYNGSIGRYSGMLDEFRVSKGIARWTADFTPPTAPYL